MNTLERIAALQASWAAAAPRCSDEMWSLVADYETTVGALQRGLFGVLLIPEVCECRSIWCTRYHAR